MRKLVFKQLHAINNASKDIIDINFLNVQRDDTIKVNTGAINKKKKQQCTDLIQSFRDCILFLIKNLRKTDTVVKYLLFI